MPEPREKIDDKLAAEYFSKHVAKIETATLHELPTTVLRWQEPGTWNCAIVYVWIGGTLMVYGDLGDAVYQWGGNINLDFLGKLNLDYFANKCQASEHGRGFKEWDEETARGALQSRIDEFIAEHDADLTGNLKPEPITADTLIENNNGWGSDSILGSQGAWAAFVAELRNYELRFPGGARMSMEESYCIGERVAMRCRLHLLGLAMAKKQIDEAERG